MRYLILSFVLLLVSCKASEYKENVIIRDSISYVELHDTVYNVKTINRAADSIVYLHDSTWTKVTIYKPSQVIYDTLFLTRDKEISVVKHDADVVKSSSLDSHSRKVRLLMIILMCFILFILFYYVKRRI